MAETIKRLFIKHREIFLYIIFGVVTTAVNWVVYAVMVRILHVDLSAVSDANVVWEMFTGSAGKSLTALFISNLTAWAAGVAVAFITNKIWVFESRVRSVGGIAREFVLFVGTRVFSGLFEWFGTPLLVILGMSQKLFGVEGFPAKILISVLVVILNYVLSKLLVFRKKKHGATEISE